MKKIYNFYFVGFLLLLATSGFSQNRVFLNGGFETPLMTTDDPDEYFKSVNTPAGTSGTRVEEWNTTAPDYNIEFRTLTTGNKGEPSAFGNQHAEINALFVSRLYQNVCLVNGETINYSFYHRGRKGQDDMEVNLYNAAGTSKVTTLKNSSDDETAWRQYSDLYFVNVPTGIYQFSFESVSASGGDKKEGNLLDEIQIGMAPLITFTKANYSAAESSVDPPALMVNGTVPVGGLDITLSITASSATEGSEYTLVKSIHIPEGMYTPSSDSIPIAFTVSDDAIVEADEHIAVSIQSITNGGITNTGCGGYSSTRYVIINDDLFDAGPDQVVCPGDSVVVNATGSVHPKWNKGVKQNILFKAPITAGDYIYTARDTIYSENLISNGNFSAGNSGFTSQYGYDPRVDPTFNSTYLQSGFYNIAGNPRLVNRFFYDLADHTGSVPSQMLIANSSEVANISFWNQTIPVQPNTEYTLTYYATSVSTFYQPQLQFSINGVPGIAHTIPSSRGWNLYSKKWNSGASTNAVIRGVNLNIVGTANDFAIDDISFTAVVYLKDSLKITVKPAPAPLTMNIDTCQQMSNHTLTATGTNLIWYNDTIAGATGSITAPVINLNIPDTLSKWVSQMINGCESPKTEIKIKIRAIPIAPLIQNLDTCQTTGTYILKAAGTNMKWYDVATNGLSGSINPSFDLNVTDTTSRWVSSTLNSCEGPRAKIDVVIKTTPVAPVIINLDTCQTTGTYILKAKGLNLRWYTLASGGVSSNISPSFNLNIPDTTSRWVSQSLNGCESPRSKIDLVIRTTPIAPVTKNLDTCQTTGTYVLKATGTNLKWYDVATNGVSGSITPLFDLNFTDTTSKWVSSTLNSCEGPRAKIDVVIKTTPAAPVIVNLDTCQTTGTYTLKAKGLNLRWYNMASGGVSSNITPSFNLNIPDTTSRWVSQSLNGCESPTSKIDLAIRTTPIAPVTKNLDTCQTTGTYILKATGINLKWYDVATNGVSASIIPSFNLNVTDTTSKWVSSTLNSCEGPRAKIDVVIKTTPVAPVIVNLDTCQTTGTYILKAKGLNLRWYNMASGGVSSNITPSFNLNIPDTTSRWVSQFSGCEGPRSKIDIIIRTAPVAPFIKNLDTCQTTGTYILKASGSNLKWYNVAANGSESTITPSFNLNTPVSTSRWVSQPLNGCESPRAKANINIKALPTGPTVRDTAICQQAGTITLKATGTLLTWYDAASAGNIVTNLTFSALVADTNSMWVSQTIAGCEGPRSKITLFVKALPIVPAVKDTNICQKTGTLSFKATGVNLLWYPIGSTIGNALAPSVNTNIPQTTSYSVSQNLNGCEGPKAMESIEVRASPLAPSATNQKLCESTGSISYIASGTNPKWYTSTTATTFSAITPSELRNNPGLHKMYVSQTQNNCESPRKEVGITITPLPSMPDISDAKYCIKDVAKPLTTLTDSLLWYKAAANGVPSSNIPIPNTQTAGVTSHWVSMVKSGCEGPRKEVKVKVNNLPVVTISGTVSGSYCAKSALAFKANGAVQYEWQLPSGSHSAQSVLNIFPFSAAYVGKYVLKGTDINQCSAKDSIVLSLRNPPSVSAQPVSVCEKAPIRIQAQTTGTAYWKLPGNRIQNSPTLSIPKSAYSDNGKYVVVSTQNGCTDSTEIMISVSNCKPEAIDDQYSVYSDEVLKFSPDNHPIFNDSDPNDQLLAEDITILTTPRFGQFSQDANGFLTYTVNSETEAMEIVEYRVCDRGIPVLCATARLKIEIKMRDAFLPDAFTPNGDGINDVYTVYHLPPQVKVELNVFDRWGDLVYQSKDYKNDWKGTCAHTTCNGSELPAGTYFVVAQLSNGSKQTTHLTLNR